MTINWSHSLEDTNWQELADLYERAPLTKKDSAKLQQAFTNSMFRWIIRDEGHIIGAGRALADGCECAYICDVAILPEYQGQGLGKAMVRRLIEQAQDHRRILLYCVPGKEGFYKALGFKRMTTAMAIFQDEPSYFARGYLTDE
jgi:ribosomal protein S18 acetylase RimI-like enzyme